MRFVSIGGFTLNWTREGRTVGVVPRDQIAWTKLTARAVNAITEAASGRDLMHGAEFVLTGETTPLAKRNLQTLGWKVTENWRE